MDPGGVYQPNPDSICEEHEQEQYFGPGVALPTSCFSREARTNPAPPFFAAKQLWEREALNQESCGLF